MSDNDLSLNNHCINATMSKKLSHNLSMEQGASSIANGGLASQRMGFKVSVMLSQVCQ
jgi:hypothetical protein